MPTKIEWTRGADGSLGETWNPVAGCTWASPGCDHCYAATMTRRLEAMGQADYAGLTTHKHFNGVVRPLPHKLDAPLKWRKPRRVFVNSMSDLFHKDVPFEFVDRVFAVMASSSRHTYQVLTKRPERMAAYLARVTAMGAEHANLFQSSLIDYYSRHGVDLSCPYQVPGRPTPELRFIYDSAVGVDPRSRIEDRAKGAFGETHWRPWPLSNVWLGTSVENQETADERIPHLLRCPAAVRFLSCEPLLGSLRMNFTDMGDVDDLGWIIVGGESGPGARPMHPQWARDLRDQCVSAGVPFFFKQWGEWRDGSWGGPPAAVLSNGRYVFPDTYEGRVALSAELRGEWDRFHPAAMARVGKKHAGRLLDGREWNEMPNQQEPTHVE